MQDIKSDCLYNLKSIDGKLTSPLAELLRQLYLCDCDLGVCGIQSKKHIVEIKLDISRYMGENKMTSCFEFVLLDVFASELKEVGCLEPIFYNRGEERSLYLNILRCESRRNLEITPKSGIYLWEVDYTDTKWPLVRVGSAAEIFRAINIIRQIRFNDKLKEWNRYHERFLKESLALSKLG